MAVPEWLLALGGSLLLVLIHAPREPLFARLGISPTTIVSFSGGVSLSYVVLHLLVELVMGGRQAIHAVLPFGPESAKSLMLVLLIALVLFFVLHQVVACAPGRPRAYRVVMLPYVLYNAVVGGALLGEETHEGPLNLLLFLLALGLHMMVNDYHLTRQLPPEVRRPWKLALALAPAFGCLVWLVAGLPAELFYVLLAFIAGSNILSVLQRELPAPEETRLGAFLVGAALIAGVTLLQWWL